MKHSRLLVAAALASSLGLPVGASAQVNNGGLAGSSNYGIFGGGTSQNGGFSGSSQGGGFSGSRFGQQGLGSPTAGTFGRSTSPLGSPTVSPYLNLLQPGTSPAVSYYALVRPQVRQDTINSQVGTSIQQTDRILNTQQQIARPAFDPYAANTELATNALPQNNRKAEDAAPAAPRRRASDDVGAGFNDWASGSRDSGFTADVRTPEDAKQRAAAIRRARELKALEDELSGNSDSGANTTQPARTGAAQPTAPLGAVNQARPANHYFPQPTGTLATRTGTPR